MILTYEFKIEITSKGFILSWDSNDPDFFENKEFYKTKEDVLDVIRLLVDEKV